MIPPTSLKNPFGGPLSPSGSFSFPFFFFFVFSEIIPLIAVVKSFMLSCLSSWFLSRPLLIFLASSWILFLSQHALVYTLMTALAPWAVTPISFFISLACVALSSLSLFSLFTHLTVYVPTAASSPSGSQRTHLMYSSIRVLRLDLSPLIFSSILFLHCVLALCTSIAVHWRSGCL